ncbi:C6 transcription factor GliZ2 [Zalerion maritima]|uniref:C6 transcription factor GliZ2 n=1 Tax=Zalerion maritima TaxID=339359 RepID=A0AAD5WU02_9PEZI|nr:C6 transcription factor GliZ2 [Zalerion maritima]
MQRRSDVCTLPERYSYRAHVGKPKGSLNKKTIERLRAEGRETPRASSNSDHSQSQDQAIRQGQPEQQPDVAWAEGTNLASSLGSIASPRMESPACAVGDNSHSMAMALPPSDLDLSMLGGPLDDFGGTLCGLGNYDPMLIGCHTPHQPTSGNPDHIIVADEASHVGHIPEPAPPFDTAPSRSDAGDPPSPPSYCSCVHGLTEQVETLHAALRSQPAAGLDKMLMCTQRTTLCVSGFAQCHSCTFDVHAFHLVAVVMSLTMDLIRPLVDPARENARPQMEIRVGNLDFSKQLGEVLEKVVVCSQLGALWKAMEKFDMKVDFLTGDSRHLEFLKYEVTRLKRGFKKIADQTGSATGTPAFSMPK